MTEERKDVLVVGDSREKEMRMLAELSGMTMPYLISPMPLVVNPGRSVPSVFPRLPSSERGRVAQPLPSHKRNKKDRDKRKRAKAARRANKRNRRK